MNSRVLRSFFFAALLGAPLVGFGQVMHTQAGGTRTGSLTLLPGPYLTSPATLSSGTSVAVISFTPDVAKIDEEIRATRERLRRLEQEREAALARRKMLEGKLPPLPIGGLPETPGVDWIHFDFKAPLAPKTQLRP